MRLKTLVGSGDRIMTLTLPFLAAAIVGVILHPPWIFLGFGTAGLVVGIVLLAAGVPAWLASVALVIIVVPKKKLITTGPFAVVAHPLYTSVALLVLPGLGLVLDTWTGAAVGAALYGATRLCAPAEEKVLAKVFPKEYGEYRARLLIPWL